MEEIKILFEDMVRSVMDSLEEYIERFKVAGGMRLKEVWFVVLVFLVFSILLNIFKVKTFISWKESLVALVLISGICILDYLNVNGTEKIKERFINVKKEDDGK